MSTEQSSPFGLLLKRHRLAAGLSQEELAARAGLSPHGISDLERGARRAPRPGTVRLLAEALGLDGDERAAFLRIATRRQSEEGTDEADPGERSPVERGAGEASAGAGTAETPPRVRLAPLPVQPTPLVGREREVERLTALLRREDVRLVTITGPGGVGKTRLGIQVAVELAGSFADGVALARLSRVSDPALVLPAIAEALALRESGGQSLAASVRVHLRDRRLLLLLDNFEQVAEAAPEVAALLEDCPALKVLITSRAGLHVRAEHEFAISPLALPPDSDLDHPPSPERLSQYAAVALFVARARAARADFQLTDANAPAVAAICVRLDGLPLAIELAAARVKLLPPAALLARLEQRLPLLNWGQRDLEERQRTMERAIAWSDELLAAEERHLFHRLSVFTGGWTLEAAEAICAAPTGAAPLAIEVLDGLSALVDHSLVRRHMENEQDEATGNEPRFSMLHVIREYALMRLEASDEVDEAPPAAGAWEAPAAAFPPEAAPSGRREAEAGRGGRRRADEAAPLAMRRADEARATRAAHAAYFAEHAQRAARALNSQSEGPWRKWLASERDNLRAALDWASQAPPAAGVRGTPAAGGRRRADTERSVNQTLWIATALAYDDLARGSYTEARQRIEHVLTVAANDSTVDREALLLAVSRAGLFASAQHDVARAMELGHQELSLARELGQPQRVANALAGLAILSLDAGAIEDAARYAEESLTLARRDGDAVTVAYALENLALARLNQGDMMQARTLAAEGLELSQRTGFLWGLGVNAGVLALVLCHQGDPIGALRMMRDGTRALVEHGGRHGLIAVLRVAACAWAAAGESERSARVVGAAETAMAEAEGTPGLALLRWTEEMTASARTALGEVAWAKSLAAGRALTLAEALTEALDVIASPDEG